MLNSSTRVREGSSPIMGKARLRSATSQEDPTAGETQPWGSSAPQPGVGLDPKQPPDTNVHGTGYGPGDSMPSPESQFGGMMNHIGQLTPNAQGPTPNPVAGHTPVPNMLPSPSPRALTGGLAGRAGGLLGGGMGVLGNGEAGKSDPTELLALLASLFGK